MNYPLTRAREQEQKIWEEKHAKIREGKFKFMFILHTENSVIRFGLVEMAHFYALSDRHISR